MQLANRTMKLGLLLMIFNLFSLQTNGQSAKNLVDSNTILVKLKPNINPSQWIFKHGQSPLPIKFQE